MLGTKSKQMALLAAHIYRITHALCKVSISTKKMFRTKTDPNLSIGTVKTERKSLSLSGLEVVMEGIYNFFNVFYGK